MIASAKRNPAAQRGYSLIELSVAMVIALFLLAGLVTLVMGTRKTSNTQSQLSQLQDNERIAMTILANVIQQAGYYPDPVHNTSSSSLPSQTLTLSTGTIGTFAAGQALIGTYNSAAPGDVVAARFVQPVASSDSANAIGNTIITCAGSPNTDTANTHRYINLFLVGTGSDGQSYLQCVQVEDTGAAQTPVNLVPGLQKIQVWYGVTRPAQANFDTSVNTYLTAANMASTDWANVTSVKIRLTFLMPNYGMSPSASSSVQYSSAANTTQYIERVISVMNNAGVNT